MSLAWVRPLAAVALPCAILGWALWHRVKRQLPADRPYPYPRSLPEPVRLKLVWTPPRIYDADHDGDDVA